MKNWNAVAGLFVALCWSVVAVRADEKPEPLKPPKGQELFAVKLAEPAAAGFVGPGSRVNLVYKLDKKTVVVAENLLVYAVDSKSDSDETVYSLGMTKEQIEAASKQTKKGGKPDLILKKPTDK